MRISDWSSDVCSSDLAFLRDTSTRSATTSRRISANGRSRCNARERRRRSPPPCATCAALPHASSPATRSRSTAAGTWPEQLPGDRQRPNVNGAPPAGAPHFLSTVFLPLFGGPPTLRASRSEEHTSELQSLMRLPY